MARRLDSGWRDESLAVRHSSWGFDAPAPGMTFPMIEYDRGEPLAVISYIRRGVQLPTGSEVMSAYNAFGSLYRETGDQQPFFTVMYDPRNWSYKMFGHNESARSFLDTSPYLARGSGWVRMTEKQFANNLYRLRGRYAPDLSAYGVTPSEELWPELEPDVWSGTGEAWPGQLMSERRRNFEPVGQTRMTWRNPCLDIDLAVTDQDGHVALVVDYKAPGARINVTNTNAAAMSKLYVTSRSYRVAVPAMVVRYEPDSAFWKFRVHCLNKSARHHLAYTLGCMPSVDADMDTMAKTIAGVEWVDLTEAEWCAVLRVAREV